MAYYATQGIARGGPLDGEVLTVYGIKPAEYYFHPGKRSIFQTLLRRPLKSALYVRVCNEWVVQKET